MAYDQYLAQNNLYNMYIANKKFYTQNRKLVETFPMAFEWFQCVIITFYIKRKRWKNNDRKCAQKVLVFKEKIPRHTFFQIIDMLPLGNHR